MMADIFDTNLIVPESYESSCLGACVLGLKALGEIEDFSIIEEMVGTTNGSTPKRLAVSTSLANISSRNHRSTTPPLLTGPPMT